MSKQISESESNDTYNDTKTNDLVSQAFGQNITEDILEKWITESDINKDGKVNYNSFLHKIKHQKKKRAENYLFKEIEQCMQEDFEKLDQESIGFLSVTEIKHAILNCLDKKFQDLLGQSNVGKEIGGEEDDSKTDSVNHSISNKTVMGSMPSPPDGGWGWVIVFACFMCNLIINGFRFGAFGVLLLPLKEHFESPISSLAWAGSLSCGLLSILGPLTGGLINKFGLRPVCISGSIVACIGLCLATLSPSVPVLIFTMGVIGGIGYGMVNLPSKVAIGYYFESKRALATGLSETGSGVGTFVFSTLMTNLVVMYDWKAAIFVMAGLCFSCIIFGALMRPLQIVHQEPEKTEDSTNGSKTANKTFIKKFGDALLPVSPKKLFSKKEEKNVTPFSKKCVLYGGDVQKLIMSEDDKKFPEWNGCKNVLLFTPKVTDCDACPDKGGFWVIHKHKGIYDRLLEIQK